MKKLFKTSLVILASLGLVGCNRASDSSSSSSEPTSIPASSADDPATSSTSSVTHKLTFTAPAQLLVGEETTFVASFDGSPLTPTEQAKVVYTASPADALTITGNKAVGAKVTNTVTVTAKYEGVTGTATLKVYEVTAKDRHDAYMTAWENSASATSTETVTIQGVLKGYEQYSGSTNMNAYIQEGAYGYWVNNLPATDENGATISIGDSIQVVGTTYYGTKAKKYPCIKPTTTTKLTTAITADALTLGASSNVFADSRHAQIKAENITIAEVSEDKSTYSFAIGSDTYKLTYNTSASNTGDAIKTKLADVGVGRVITSVKGFWGNNATASVNDEKIISVTSADDIVLSETYPAATALTVTGATTVGGLKDATETYTAVVTPSGAKQTVNWSVTDAEGAETSVATISAAGVLTIADDVSETKTINVVATSTTDATIKNSLSVSITKVDPATAVSITATGSKTSINLDSETTLQLTATVSPATASQAVVWSSSNDKVATVDANGLVTGVTDGTTTITATSKYNAEIKATYDISVTRTITPIADLMTKGDALSSNGTISGTYTVKGVITAISGKNAILSDGTNALEIYGYDNMSNFASGNYVAVTGTFQRYYKLIETKTISSIVLAQTNDQPSIPASETYDASKVDTLGANTGYIAGTSFKIDGKMTVDGSYKNLKFDGNNYYLSLTACDGVTLTENAYGTYECIAVSVNTSKKFVTVFVTGFTASAKEASPSAVEITNTNLDVKVGNTLQMKAQVLTTEDGTVDQTVTWSVFGEDGTSTTSLATIDASTGLLTAATKGKVTVKATSTKDTTKSVTKIVAIHDNMNTMDFTDTTKMESCNQYTQSWKATTEDSSKLTMTNFSNNSLGWKCVACGRKSNASVATITTDAAITFAVNSVKINFTQFNNSDKVNSIKLKVASDGSFANNLQTIDFTDYTTGLKEITVTTPTANMFYQLEFDLQMTGANGSIRLDSLMFLGD